MTNYRRVACEACRSFVAECVTPVGDGAADLCWLCAHHVVEHGCSLSDAPAAECECLPAAIYPPGTPAYAEHEATQAFHASRRGEREQAERDRRRERVRRLAAAVPAMARASNPVKGWRARGERN